MTGPPATAFQDYRRSWAGYCSFCGVLLCHDHRRSGKQCPRESTWDHIVPGLHGKGVVGRHKVVACSRCNSSRGALSIPDWRDQLIAQLEDGVIDDAWRGWAEAVVEGLEAASPV